MSNVVIYSDGTGQRGGLMFDERRSNIYKLYRGTRCGPDSSVDPSKQLTFYDPGLGTLPTGHYSLIGTAWRLFYNLASRATGLGLTGNIIDCYAAIVRLWRPGDRIFLFGFSRGAYTVRCLSAVVGMCGVPTQDEDGKPLRRDDKTSKRIASEAVKKVYQHTASRKATQADERAMELLDQRRELARRFRGKYKSTDFGDPTKSNAFPYFIGVFDTVASLVNPVAIVGLSLLALAVFAIPSGVLWYLKTLGLGFWAWYGILAGSAIVIAYVLHTSKRIRYEFGLPRKKTWRFFHFTEPRMKFYDTDLNPNVEYARHALSINESRANFQRVPWGTPDVVKTTVPVWLEQRWFAGNHSDIGGSYPENESRLSDVSLKWMLDAAAEVGLIYDSSVLKVFPDPAGPQHDEARSSFFRYAKKLPREIGADFPLHPSVIERFEADEVLDYDTMRPYRPDNLRSHGDVKRYYDPP